MANRRSKLIRLASTLPKGSAERKALLRALASGREAASEKLWSSMVQEVWFGDWWPTMMKGLADHITQGGDKVRVSDDALTVDRGDSRIYVMIGSGGDRSWPNTPFSLEVKVSSQGAADRISETFTVSSNGMALRTASEIWKRLSSILSSG